MFATDGTMPSLELNGLLQPNDNQSPEEGCRRDETEARVKSKMGREKQEIEIAF